MRFGSKGSYYSLVLQIACFLSTSLSYMWKFSLRCSHDFAMATRFVHSTQLRNTPYIRVDVLVDYGTEAELYKSARFH